MRTSLLWLAAGVLCAACGDDGGDDGGAGSDGSTATGSEAEAGPGPGTDGGSEGDPSTDDGTTGSASTGGAVDSTGGQTGDSGDSDGDTAGTSGGVSDCDYETIDGRLVIEAEALPVGESWQTATDEPGFYGDGYLVWTGASSNNDPSQGVTTVTLRFAEPGLYRLQWRNRIGMGNNTTEHNDTWVRLPDVAAFYGRQPNGDQESRVYPRPLCEDADAMAAVAALPEVSDAGCPAGTSSDGFFKVYSSGASDWSWSTWTSDSDAHRIMIEIDAAGDYTFTIAARGDWHLIDRIVIADDALDDAVVQDPDAAPTACR